LWIKSTDALSSNFIIGIMGRKTARNMYSYYTNNKIGTQCFCWFYSQGIYHDARSYNLKIRFAESFRIFPFSIFPLCCYVTVLFRTLLSPWLGDQLRSKSLEKLNPRATTTPWGYPTRSLSWRSVYVLNKSQEVDFRVKPTWNYAHVLRDL
jgi:hypothetical protein